MQLWHTIPLCLLTVVDLLLVIVALLGLASYRVVIGGKDLVCDFVESEIEAYDDGLVATDNITVISD